MKSGESIEQLVFAFAVSTCVFVSALVFYGVVIALTALILIILVFTLLKSKGFFDFEQKRLKLVEKELPLFIELFTSNEGSFESKIRDSNGFGELSVELRKVFSAMQKGVSVKNALESFSERNNSVFLKKFSKAMYSFYSKKDFTELLTLEKTFSLHKLNELRTFSSKAALIGLVFVSVSLIVPALFSAYLMIGSSFLEVSFTDVQILVLFLLVFPVADCVLLNLVLKKTPVF